MKRRTRRRRVLLIRNSRLFLFHQPVMPSVLMPTIPPETHHIDQTHFSAQRRRPLSSSLANVSAVLVSSTKDTRP
jgi:hypothetical protein